MKKQGFTDGLVQAASYHVWEREKAKGQKRDLADWLEMLAIAPGICLFVVQFLMLGMIHHGSHFTVRTQPFFVPRRIEVVAEARERIYVLYHDSGAVNVYNSDGTFLWSFSVPWHDHASDIRIQLKGDDLYLYQREYHIYRFDALTGKYRATYPYKGNEAEFPDESQVQTAAEEERLPGMCLYDGLTVYRVGENGELCPLIHRSGWVRLLYFNSAWILCILGIVAAGFIHSDIGPALRRKKERKMKNAGA